MQEEVGLDLLEQGTASLLFRLLEDDGETLPGQRAREMMRSLHESHVPADGRRKNEDGLRLLSRQPERMLPRQLPRGHALVDVGGHDGIGRHPDPVEQIKSAGARRSEDQAHQG